MRRVLYVLGQLSDEDADWLAATGERHGIAAGAALVSQGKPLDWIYIVLDGHVAVMLEGRGEIARLGSGEIVGEMSLVDDRPPSASVRAVDAVQVLALRKSDLSERLATDTGFAARFYKAVAIFLSHRMRHTVATLGYDRRDNGEPSLDDAASADDEVDLALLDTVNKAGARFDRLLKRLMAPGAG